MGRIRAFVQDDIPMVAELNWQFLQGQTGPHPPRLEEYLRQVFFQNPWFDSSIGSLVYEEGQRRVVGFLGIVPRPMSVNGKPVQAAFGSGLVVHPESRWALPGPQLLAAFMNGKQDLAMTDTANGLSQQIWVSLGGNTSAAYSLQWARPLRPGSYALYAMSRFGREDRSGTGSRACRVLHKTVSTVARRIPRVIGMALGFHESDESIRKSAQSCLARRYEGNHRMVCLLREAGWDRRRCADRGDKAPHENSFRSLVMRRMESRSDRSPWQARNSASAGIIGVTLFLLGDRSLAFPCP